jgi:hypothetical protein
VLVEKLLEQVDVTALVAKLTPELVERLMTGISIETLKKRVLELLASKVAGDPVLIETLSAQLLACL